MKDWLNDVELRTTSPIPSGLCENGGNKNCLIPMRRIWKS